jgi:hypothetical protein
MSVTVIVPLGAQDTTGRKDTLPPPAPAPVPPPPVAPTIEQIRYMEGLKTVTRGIAQLKNGLDRVNRTQRADSLTRRRAARRLGGLCTSARSFIVAGRPRMQPAAYTDSMRIVARQLTTRLDSLNAALPNCEKTAGRDPAVATDLSKRLQAYDDALLAFRNAQRPDSTKTAAGGTTPQPPM